MRVTERYTEVQGLSIFQEHYIYTFVGLLGMSVNRRSDQFINRRQWDTTDHRKIITSVFDIFFKNIKTYGSKTG